MPEEISSNPQECLRAINALQDELRSAKKTLLNSETCVVNRNVMLAQLEYLQNNIPEAVTQAAEIVSNEEALRQEWEQRRTEMLSTASIQAQDKLNEASQKANQMAEQASQMVEQASRDANTIKENAHNAANAYIENAKQEAARIVEEAEKKAAELVSEENIVKRARVESDELKENARQEAANLHKNTLDYIDSLLADTDRKMSELINNIRLERNEIQNHR